MPSVLLALTIPWACKAPGPGSSDRTQPTSPGTGISSTLLGAIDADPLLPEPPPYPAPELLSVDCAPTDNELRYTCTIEVVPPQPVVLHYARTDGLSVERRIDSEQVAQHHELSVRYLAGGIEHELRASAQHWPYQEVTTTLQPDPVPPEIDTWLEVSGASGMGLLGTHLPCSAKAIAVIYDTHTGDLVWYHELDEDGSFGSLNMIQFTDEGTVLGETGDDVVEVDLDGNELLHLHDVNAMLGANATFWGLHHDVFKRDGVVYVMHRETYGDDQHILDVVVMLDEQANVLARWDPLEHLDIPDGWSGNWLHTNTIYVDEAGDIYLSWLIQEAIGKIEGDLDSPDFGTPIWILTGAAGSRLEPSFEIDWSGIDDTEGFDHQHSLNLTPQGEVLMLDNGHGRGLSLQVDEVVQSAVATGVYPTTLPSCGEQGTARATASGHVLVGCREGDLREYDAAGALVWEAALACDPSATHHSAARWYPLDGW